MFQRCPTTFCAAFFLAIAALAPAPAWAWGAIGHRITGTIAEENISGRTRAEIRAILGAESLAEAATAPDEERSNPAPFWQETAGPWHYVTFPAGARAAQLAHPPEGDAITALARFTATLRDAAAPREERALALRFIAHIIGDLHQPLHAGREGDRGGNDVIVRWFGETSNLHAVWDSGMIDRQDYAFSEYTERLNRHRTGAETIAWWSAEPEVWLDESIALRDQLYPATSQEAGLGTAESPVRLSWTYLYQWKPAMEQRLSQAGIRLAAYLDAVFAPVPQ